MAASHDKSLEAFIENTSTAKADNISVEASTNPSPSGDSWFDDPKNMESVMRGIEDAEQEKTKAYSMDDGFHVFRVIKP